MVRVNCLESSILDIWSVEPCGICLPLCWVSTCLPSPLATLGEIVGEGLSRHGCGVGAFGSHLKYLIGFNQETSYYNHLKIFLLILLDVQVSHLSFSEFLSQVYV